MRILLLALLMHTVSISQIEKSIDNQIIRHSGFILSYNETCEQANWVYYKVTESDLENPNAVRSNRFIEDTLVITKSASQLDYYKSGYDKGHIAPSASFVHDQVLNNETFLMSNMSPQSPSFNRGMWKKLEIYERQLAYIFDTVYIIAGPILDSISENIGKNQVCVPKYYYKIFIDSDWNVIDCYIMQNKKLYGKLSDFKTDIKSIETRTKIDIFKDILNVY